MMLDRSQRKLLANKFMDLANLVITALVFGQMLGNERRWGGFITGVILYLILLIFSYLIQKGVEQAMSGQWAPVITMGMIIIIALIIGGPTFYHDWKKSRAKKHRA